MIGLGKAEESMALVADRGRMTGKQEGTDFYAQLGDKSQTFKWLGKAGHSRSCMYWLRQDPRFDSVHADSRFQDLLTKMQFPQLQ